MNTRSAQPGTFAARPGSFVDPELAERHTDLLFSIRTHSSVEALIYLLFEHQSTADPHMAYRLLRYMVNVWGRWRDDHGTGVRLPAIVPVVLYHGPRPWSAPQSLQALVDVPAGLKEGLEPFVPSFDYLVDDLSATPDEALRRRALMTALAKLVLACFKHLRTDEDPIEILGEWVDVLDEVARAPTGLEALELVLRYIMSVSGQVESEALQSFLEREVSPEAKETVMTLAEQLIEQGVQQGEVQGERKLLLRLLRQRFGDELKPDTEHRVATATAAEIETWASRVLSASTLDDVLAS